MSDFKEFLKAINNGDREGVKRLFRQEYIKEITEGMTALHSIIMSSNDDVILRFLLSQGFNIEETDWTGWKCIHMAAWGGQSVTMNILIDAGCSIDCKDNYGRTPLDLAILRNNDACVQILMSAMERKETKTSIKEKNNIKEVVKKSNTRDSDLLLEKNPLSEVSDNQIGEISLPKLLCDNDPCIIEEIKAKPIQDKEIQDWECSKLRLSDPEFHQLLHKSLLYRCIRHKHDEGFYTLCTPNIVNKDTLFMGLSTLESAVELDMILYVNHVLMKLVHVNETWENAKNLAQQKEFHDISLLISQRIRYLEHKKKRGYSRLHIAVLDNDSQMVEYILENNLVNVDEGDKGIGTALSLAYDMAAVNCIQSLQNYKVNVNTVNKLRQSPLHIAIQNHIEDYCDYLVDNILDLEAEDYIGFNVLERSVMNDCMCTCEKLLRKGARYDQYVNINNRLLDDDHNLGMILKNKPFQPITNYETVYTLCFKVNGTLYPCLLETLDKNTIELTDNYKNTLLHLSAVSFLPDICFQLISKGAKVDCLNNCGDCPLWSMLKHYKSEGFRNAMESRVVKIINILKDSGATITADERNKINVLEMVSENYGEKILVALLHKEDKLLHIQKKQWLKFFNKDYNTFIKKLIPLLNKKVLSQWITEDLIRSNLETMDSSFVKLLYANASYEVQINVVEEILCEAVENGDSDIFEEFINDDISPSSYLEDGRFLMTSVLLEENNVFFKLLIKSKNVTKFLEKKNSENKISIHICIESENWSFLETLISRTNSVNEEDKYGNTPLSLLFEKISITKESELIDRLLTFIKALINKSANIYQVNKLDRSAIMYCTKSRLKLKIESYYKEKQSSSVTTNDSAENKSCTIMAKTNSSKKSSPREVTSAPTLSICSLCNLAARSCVIDCGHIFCETCVDPRFATHCSQCGKQITNRIKLLL